MGPPPALDKGGNDRLRRAVEPGLCVWTDEKGREGTPGTSLPKRVGALEVIADRDDMRRVGKAGTVLDNVKQKGAAIKNN
jgi:hypothetical protein